MSEKKRPVGRPVTTGTTQARSIRVPQDVWDRWTAHTDANGTNISEWLRGLADAELDRVNGRAAKRR